MSLNAAEVAATSKELHTLRKRIALDDATLEAALGYEPGGLEAALNIEAGPVEVWRTRDYLVALAQKHGISTPRFSRLSDAMRPQAQRWFGRWDVPAV